MKWVKANGQRSVALNSISLKTGTLLSILLVSGQSSATNCENGAFANQAVSVRSTEQAVSDLIQTAMEKVGQAQLRSEWSLPQREQLADRFAENLQRILEQPGLFTALQGQPQSVYSAFQTHQILLAVETLSNSIIEGRSPNPISTAAGLKIYRDRTSDLLTNVTQALTPNGPSGASTLALVNYISYIDRLWGSFDVQLTDPSHFNVGSVELLIVKPPNSTQPRLFLVIPSSATKASVLVASPGGSFSLKPGQLKLKDGRFQLEVDHRIDLKEIGLEVISSVRITPYTERDETSQASRRSSPMDSYEETILVKLKNLNTLLSLRSLPALGPADRMTEQVRADLINGLAAYKQVVENAVSAQLDTEVLAQRPGLFEMLLLVESIAQIQREDPEAIDKYRFLFSEAELNRLETELRVLIRETVFSRAENRRIRYRLRMPQESNRQSSANSVLSARVSQATREKVDQIESDMTHLQQTIKAHQQLLNFGVLNLVRIEIEGLFDHFQLVGVERKDQRILLSSIAESFQTVFQDPMIQKGLLDHLSSQQIEKLNQLSVRLRFVLNEE